MKYKITVEVEDTKNTEQYNRYKTVYEQIVEGDQTIVNGVVQTVLDYTTFQNDPAVAKQEA